MRKSLSKAVVLTGLLVLAILLGSCTSSGSIPTAPDLLAQIHTAFKTYTEEYDGKYPPMSPKPGKFVPDMDAFGPYLARLPEGDLLSAYLTGKCGVQLCYFGYVLPSQRVTLELLNELENRGMAAARDKDMGFSGRGVLVRTPWHTEPREWKEVSRLREGVERFFVIDPSDPRATAQAKACVAVLWEMPDSTPAAGGWVLYMDGHTEWLPYGSFPMTGKIVTHVRHFVPPPVEKANHGEYQVDSRPTQEYRRMKVGPSPVHQIAADVADSLPLGCYKLTYCDITPSVKVLGYEGYRIVYESCIEVELFPEVVLFSADIEVDDEFKHHIWPRASEERNTVVADLGVRQGYHWFARASVWLQDNFREDFGLTGGDDRLQHMIDTRR